MTFESLEQKRMRKSLINLAPCVDEGFSPDDSTYDSIYGSIKDSIKDSINKPVCKRHKPPLLKALARYQRQIQ
jgi:hypothetical protein